MLNKFFSSFGSFFNFPVINETLLYGIFSIIFLWVVNIALSGIKLCSILNSFFPSFNFSSEFEFISSDSSISIIILLFLSMSLSILIFEFFLFFNFNISSFFFFFLSVLISLNFFSSFSSLSSFSFSSFIPFSFGGSILLP